jgi:hypothetical protein
MNSYLVALAPVLETGVINEIGTTVFSGNDGVVSLRAFSVVVFCLVTPRGVSTENVDAPVTVVLPRTEVQQIRLENGAGIA